MSDVDTPQFRKMLELSEKVKDIAKGANTMLAPMMLRDFILGMDITNNLLASAIRDDIKADARVKHAEAVAYFDKAPQYLKDNKIKDSSEAKKMYIPLDEDVQSAKDRKAQTESLVAFLKNKLQEFRMAHDDVKKMAYANDYSNSPNEGM
jgi:hypothetical protein